MIIGIMASAFVGQVNTIDTDVALGYGFELIKGT
tara:strand:+ start:1083 stop:1184 length:102 start_codon:yes stop_codon:yes gene_type:complete